MNSELQFEIVPDLKNLSHLKTDLERLEFLLELLESFSTGGPPLDEEYKTLRSYFLEKEEFNNTLPDFIRLKRDLKQFWTFIKKYETYTERRGFLYDSFSNSFNYLENSEKNILNSTILSNEVIKTDKNTIYSEIAKALKRVNNDPEGAITLARTVLESTCKYIADQKQIIYSDKTELSVLYKEISKVLNLSPEQHHEEIFKTILGGCSAIVNGLGTLRNKLGDAHGKGTRKIQPTKRHAQLAVNLSASMSIFLLETNEHTKK